MVQTILSIEGMMCGMCEAHINEAIRRHFPVKSVKSSRAKKRCVIVSEEELNREEIRTVISDTGYALTSVETGPYRKKGLFG